MKKINVALIGYGYLGKWHAQKIFQSDKAELVAIVDPSEISLKAAAEEYPETKLVKSYDEVIGSVDAFIVVTPTFLHYKIVKDLLSKSKHVFCEKPLTSILSETIEIKEILSKKTKSVLQIGHSERVHAAWEICKEYPNYFKESPLAHFKRVAPFKGRATDVSVIEDLMIHDIDLAFYLFDKKVKSVKAKGQKIRTDQFDYVWSEVSFEDGLTCTFSASRNDVSEQRFFEVISSKGTLFVDLQASEVKVASAQEDVASQSYEKRDHLAFEQEKFYTSILEGEKVFVSIEDALNVAKVMDAMKESIHQNKEIFL